jgi:hypothetical protein
LLILEHSSITGEFSNYSWEPSRTGGNLAEAAGTDDEPTSGGDFAGAGESCAFSKINPNGRAPSKQIENAFMTASESHRFK